MKQTGYATITTLTGRFVTYADAWIEQRDGNPVVMVRWEGTYAGPVRVSVETIQDEAGRVVGIGHSGGGY